LIRNFLTKELIFFAKELTMSQLPYIPVEQPNVSAISQTQLQETGKWVVTEVANGSFSGYGEPQDEPKIFVSEISETVSLTSGMTLELGSRIETNAHSVELQLPGDASIRLSAGSGAEYKIYAGHPCLVFWGRGYVKSIGKVNTANIAALFTCEIKTGGGFVETFPTLNVDMYYSLKGETTVFEYYEDGSIYDIVKIPEGYRALLSYNENIPSTHPERYKVLDLHPIGDTFMQLVKKA
jgi:hypothetical protein